MKPGALPQSVRRQIAECLALLDRSQRGPAVAAARSLAGAADPTAVYVGSRLLFFLRLYEESLERLREHLLEHPDDGYARRLHYSFLKKLHFGQEAEAALDALLRAGDDPTLRRVAAQHYQATARPKEALAQMHYVLEAAPADARLCRWQLDLAVFAGERDIGRQVAARAMRLDPTIWFDVVEQMLKLGLLDEVEAEAQSRASTPQGAAMLAQLDLFRGDWERAYAQASAALERAPDLELALCVMVAASIAAGDLDRAQRDSSRRSGEVGPTLRTWTADLLRRRGDLQGARRELTRVQNEVPDYFAAKLLWVLVKAAIEDEPWPNTAAYEGLMEGQLAALGIELEVRDGHVAGSELRAAVGVVLEKLAGNRTPFPTTVQDGRLLSLYLPASPRRRVQEIQHKAIWMGLDLAKQRVAAELERIGNHPIARCYGAELDLWAGDYDVARQKFEDILGEARQTTWAWIGLGASRILLGDAEEGLRTLDEGVKVMGWRGATLPAIRGEALFRLGRLDEAAVEIQEACANHPSRVSSSVLRVLIADARGETAERDQVFSHLDDSAPALVADAQRAAGVEGWWPGTAPAEVLARVCEQALALMRGNRSSSCAFWLAPGTEMVRSVLPHQQESSSQWEARERLALLRLAGEARPA